MTTTQMAWHDARRILAIRLDGMGDVIMTGPALRALKESAPGRHVTLLTSEAGDAAATRLPGVDEVITYAAPWMKSPTITAARDGITHELQRRRFDAAVIFTLHTQSPLPAAALCWWAGIPLVAARCRENPYHLFTTWLPEDEAEAPFRHDVERQLGLAAAAGATTGDDRLAFRVETAARAAAAALIARQQLAGRPWCLLHPGASAPSRRYPPEQFATAARMLAEQDGWRVLVAGGEQERALVEQVSRLAGPGTAPLQPLELDALAALIEAAPILIANNSGPAHIAAAVGTPVVDLYALTNPQHAPWRVPHRLLFHDVECRSCYRSVCPEGHHACLALVTPEEVANAARELARETAPELEHTEVAV